MHFVLNICLQIWVCICIYKPHKTFAHIYRLLHALADGKMRVEFVYAPTYLRSV